MHNCYPSSCHQSRITEKRIGRKFLDDLSDTTFDLIRYSIGVITVSDIVLLDSALVGKPSYALGKPQFDSFLLLHGLDSADILIQEVVTG
jgi:hypothetical protein